MLTGDAVPDVLFVCQSESNAGGIEAGGVYVIPGPVFPGEIAVDDAAAAAWVHLRGEAADDELGRSSAIVGDVVGVRDTNEDGQPDDFGPDGVDDFLLTASEYGDARGRAYLVAGGELDDGPIDDRAHLVFEAEQDHDRLGFAGGTPGDMDGDGLPEIVLVSRGFPGRGSGDGRTYLFYGATLATKHAGDAVRVASADATFTGTAGLGEAMGVNSSSTGFRVGDLNCDGLDDLVLTALLHDPPDGEGGTYEDGGAVAIYFGRPRPADD